MTTVKTSLWAGLWSVALACGTPLTPAAEGPAAETPSPAASSSLRVVSWNVEFLDAPGRGRNGRSAEQLGSMARDLAALEADIVVLQEVASAEAVQALVGEDWTVQVESRRSDQRLAFALRPGLDAAFSELPELSVSGGLRRGLVAQVGELQVLNVHLKAGCQWDPLTRGETCQTLGEQAQVLETWLDARASEPVLIVGDFNRQLTTDDELWRALDDGEPSGLRLTAPLLDQRDQCPGSRHRHPIDHAVATAQVGDLVARQAPVQGSDHCPIVVEIDG